jgi:dipeptidyl aminopeptidase/acylaminoacyl peptidase
MQKMINKLAGIVSILILLSQLFIVHAQVFTSYDLFKIKSVSETAVSPDGNIIAYSVIIPRPFTDDPGTDYKHLYFFDRRNNTSKELITGNVSISALSWVPDSKSILFIAKFNEDKVSQVYKIGLQDGVPEKLTSAIKKIERYELNPEGNKLAFVSSEEKSSDEKNFEEKGFDAEIYEEELLNLNLFVQDINSGEIKKLTSGVTVYDFQWSPDGQKIAAVIAEKNLVDYSYMFKRIYLIDPSDGTLTKIVENPGKLSDIAWSPDSKHLAFVAGVDINDPVGGSLFVTELPVKKSFNELRNYSKDFSGSVEFIAWKDNNTILFSAEEGVDITLSEFKLDAKNRSILIEPGNAVFNNFSFNNGVISLAGSTPEHPNELLTYLLETDKLKKETELNSWIDNISLAKQEKIVYAARDGLQIEGLLVYPLNFKKGIKYPLIVYIHGGPESAVNNGWVTAYNIWGQVAAAKDFFVFMPNYRSSSGRGVEFSKMDFGDPVNAEFNDVLDGIDYLVMKGYVDSSKVGIGGGSYGGYFSAWAATKETEHFAASVVFVGVTDIISKRYTSDIPYELYNVHWGIWSHENFDLMLDRSPVKYASQSKTPTLILHGKEDTRVHPSQSLELYRALKTHGKAPVRLILYPGQGHGNSKNTSKLDFNLRTMEWFEYYLKSDNPKTEMPEKYFEIKGDDIIN